MFVKRMSRVAAALATALVMFAVLTFVASAIGLSQPPGPFGSEQGAQPPGVHPQPLLEPAQQATELPIAGRIYLIPAGATAMEFISGPPAVNAETGEAVGRIRTFYWLVARAPSTAKIDSVTGEVFDWEVAPEDLPDFEPLRSPIPAP